MSAMHLTARDCLSIACRMEPAPLHPPVLSWREHLAATLKLGLPLVGAQLAQIAIGVTDTVMIGWLGARELAAATLGSHFYFVLLMLGSGFAFALIPMVAQSAAVNDVVAVRRSTRMGLWLVAFYAVLAMPVLWNSELIFGLLGQEADISAMAADYLRIMQWSLFPALFVFVLRSFFSGLGRTRVVLAATVGAALMNGVLNYMLIFGNWGAPRLELTGAAIASFLASSASLAVLLAYSRWLPEVRRFTLFVRLWRPDWPAFFELARLGWPISLTIIAEVGMFSASSVMMGWLGAIALAAHGVALQLASVVFMIPLGLSNAATVRVGHAAALKQGENMRRAAWVVAWLSIGVTSLSAIAFLTVAEPLVSLFLDLEKPDSAEVLAYGVVLLAVAGVFQLVDGMQAVATGLLRGLKDTRTPAALAVFSYWCIGMPAAWLFGFPLALDGAGVWIGLALGLAFAAALLSARFVRLAQRDFGKVNPVAR